METAPVKLDSDEERSRFEALVAAWNQSFTNMRDVAAGKVVWNRHFDYPPPARRGRAGDPLCPTGLTATPVIGPPNASGARTLYALAGDGRIHSLNLADGEDLAQPFQFGYPNGKSYALNLWDHYLFTTTSQGCAGNPNQIWAVNLNDPEKKVMT